jgi:hypothetical protein
MTLEEKTALLDALGVGCRKGCLCLPALAQTMRDYQVECMISMAEKKAGQPSGTIAASVGIKKGPTPDVGFDEMFGPFDGGIMLINLGTGAAYRPR